MRYNIFFELRTGTEINFLAAIFTYELTYAFMGFMALTTLMVLCARSRDSVLSVSVRRVHVVLSTAGSKGEGNPCPKTREALPLLRGIQKALRT